MNTYYFSCSYPLEVGSVVNPGNWGRMIKMYDHRFGNPWVLLRETLFESVRGKSYPNKPSRLESIFLCEELEEMLHFLKGSNRVLDLIYEVELVDSSLPLHKGCLLHTNIVEQDNYDSLTQKAYHYWDATSVEHTELVTTSPVRILKRVVINRG
ncbi:DUF2441 domain-containing protein [Photobacterium halotolerans]|uniref:DUF2441 domain-containing protein n=1 Tax=Photobacterium halotolerans TaxID=265726 RepID=UPI001372D031|nr:DUF2441 domain-containing protein [Photobacterium halotolerans]NAW88782.1 DUF2441 domain-containing protein [Photobacterium halotolerans]